MKIDTQNLMLMAALSGLAVSTTTTLGADPYDPPASYYANVNGTGSLLKSQLTAAMSAGHIQRSYGDFRNSARWHDTDPNNSSRILLVYNLASVSASWDSGNTWNREHVWPQSKQPGSASNGTRGNLGDPHALRPCNPSINSSRGNKPFGQAISSGGFGSLGSFYFPGDTDKGDISRSLFYSATRYASSGLTLVNGSPGSNQMGDLGSLMAWHYLDQPGEFERRRNHVIFSQALNPAYRTNNRNAYVDHPEFAWSVFMDQSNDSTLWIGDLEPADGASTIDLMINAMVGDTINDASFVIDKSGNDGTYYRVTTSAGLNSSVDGCYNAFPMNMSGVNQPVNLSFDSSITSSAGQYLGEMRVDNLDVTTQGGAGNGANDIDDVVFVTVDVYSQGLASLSDSGDVNSLVVDMGSIANGSGVSTEAFSMYNIGDASSFDAPIDIELVSSTGDTSMITTNFSDVSGLEGGMSSGFIASLADSSAGDFEAVYTFRVYNDRSLFPALNSIEDLQITLNGSVTSGGCSIADIAEPFGQLNFFDVSAFLNAFNAQEAGADLNSDGMWNFFDVSDFLNAFGAGCP